MLPGANPERGRRKFLLSRGRLLCATLALLGLAPAARAHGGLPYLYAGLHSYSLRGPAFQARLGDGAYGEGAQYSAKILNLGWRNVDGEILVPVELAAPYAAIGLFELTDLPNTWGFAQVVLGLTGAKIQLKDAPVGPYLEHDLEILVPRPTVVETVSLGFMAFCFDVGGFYRVSSFDKLDDAGLRLGLFVQAINW